jgi:hypothetical protein
MRSFRAWRWVYLFARQAYGVLDRDTKGVYLFMTQAKSFHHKIEFVCSLQLCVCDLFTLEDTWTNQNSSHASGPITHDSSCSGVVLNLRHPSRAFFVQHCYVAMDGHSMCGEAA